MNKINMRVVVISILVIIAAVASAAACAWSYFSIGDQVIEDSYIPSVGHGDGSVGQYDYTEASAHIGERAVVTGQIRRVFVSKSGTIFLDFCESQASCPFTAVIFASSANKFPDPEQYRREVMITGVIRAYKGKAEIVLEDSSQIK